MNSSTTDLVLSTDAAIDLQLHSLHSDGTWVPQDLIAHLIDENFGLAAITDHDRMDTVAEIQRLALEKDFPILPAVEMTANWRGEMTDILCYGIDPAQRPMNELAQDVLRRQQEETHGVYQHLVQHGHVPESPEILTTILNKPSAQQPHALVDLVQSQGDQKNAESLRNIFRPVGLTFAMTDIAVVVDAAHQSGGVCLVAHPGRSDGFISYDVELLDELRQDVPLDGVEVYYPLHTPKQEAMFLDYAERHDLLISSGSDSHTPEKPPIKYPAKLSRKLLERVGIRVA